MIKTYRNTTKKSIVKGIFTGVPLGLVSGGFVFGTVGGFLGGLIGFMSTINRPMYLVGINIMLGAKVGFLLLGGIGLISGGIMGGMLFTKYMKKKATEKKAKERSELLEKSL